MTDTNATQVTPTIPVVDPSLIDATLAAALASYSIFDHPKHANYKVPGYTALYVFTGWDGIIDGLGTVETFGLIYRSDANPSEYIVAFRGTDSASDWYEDADFFDTVDFKPTNSVSGFPSDVAVSSGFCSIYNDKGGSMSSSMREQIFDFFSSPGRKPTKVLVTGHSLGAALANLFALDLAASLPGVQVINTTYASPKTGMSKFQHVYDVQYGLKSSTYRCFNQWDVIPTLPPHTIFGYDHVGMGFPISFYEPGFFHLVHLGARHSLLNYQYILSRAVQATPQVWVGYFTDATDKNRMLYSATPTVSEEQDALADALLALSPPIEIETGC